MYVYHRSPSRRRVVLAPSKSLITTLHADQDARRTRGLRWTTEGRARDRGLLRCQRYKAGRASAAEFITADGLELDSFPSASTGATYAAVLAGTATPCFGRNRAGPAGTACVPVRDRNDWATKPWQDIESGIDKLIADGIADPKRLGVMGWSYGGYLASWVLGHSDRFVAYSIGAPVVDLLSYHGTADIRDFIPHYFTPLSLDRIPRSEPALALKKTSAKCSPGTGDRRPRAALAGDVLYRMLDELGVDVTMVAYPGHRTAFASRS